MLAVLGLIFADGEPARNAGGIADSFMFLVAPLLLFLVFIVLPMRRDTRMRREMLSLLKKGDRVLLNGFMVGQVVQMVKSDRPNTEDELIVKGEDGHKIRVLRGSVTRILKSEETKDGN